MEEEPRRFAQISRGAVAEWCILFGNDELPRVTLSPVAGYKLIACEPCPASCNSLTARKFHLRKNLYSPQDERDEREREREREQRSNRR